MSGCQDDLTAVDVELAPSLLGRIAGGSSTNTNLFTSIDRDNVFGLNLVEPETAQQLIKPWDARESLEAWADSAEDDEMIIHVPFTQSVRVKSFLVKSGRGESCLGRVRLYVNLPNGLGFSDVQDLKVTQDIGLLENAETVVEYPVRVAAFASVSSVTLFFSNSAGGDSSRVYYVGFKGETMRPLREAAAKMDIPAANAADAPVDRLAERAPGNQSTIR